LNRAHVLGAVSHVTAVDYWFLDIAVGANGRTVHATVAIDEVAKAQSEDLDCPDLNEEWVAFNLLKITENDEDMLDVCSITPETTAGAWSTLGGAGKTLEVTGQRRVFAPSRPWDLAAASEPASIGSNGANSEGCACAERGASLGSEIEFKLIDEGSCESAGMYTIMNEDTCRKAGEIVDNSPGKPVKVSENRIDRPKGCVLHNHQKGSADKPTELFLGGYLDGCEKGGYDCICVRMASRGGGGGGAFHDGGHRHAAMQHVVVDGTEPDAKVKPEHVPGPNPKPEPESEPNNPDSVVMPDATSEPDAKAGPDAKAEPDASAEPDAEAGPDAKAEPDASAEPDAMAGPDAKAEPVASAEPDAEAGPDATAEPDTTVEPDAKAEPEASAEPGAKAEPDAKAEPVASAEPDAKAGPDATVEPDANAEPEASAEPGAKAQPDA
jgi:hypothetical protein